MWAESSTSHTWAALLGCPLALGLALKLPRALVLVCVRPPGDFNGDSVVTGGLCSHCSHCSDPCPADPCVDPLLTGQVTGMEALCSPQPPARARPFTLQHFSPKLSPLTSWDVSLPLPTRMQAPRGQALRSVQRLSKVGPQHLWRVGEEALQCGARVGIRSLACSLGSHLRTVLEAQVPAAGHSPWAPQACALSPSNSHECTSGAGHPHVPMYNVLWVQPCSVFSLAVDLFYRNGCSNSSPWFLLGCLSFIIELYRFFV